MTRIVIDYETDPDFSFCDEDEWDCPSCGHHNDCGASCAHYNCNQNYLVSLCTALYDNNDKLVGSLSNSVFYEAADDWETGTFNTVDDIPARCPHLREVATELLREYRSKMKTYTITVAANVRAYATIEIEAENEEAAEQRVQEIKALVRIWDAPEMQNENVVFEAAYDTLDDVELLEDDLMLSDDRE
jgi:hypothetical protein